MQPPSPARAGSSRHSACLPSASPASQPCGYSTTTLRTVPNAPAADPVARLAHHRIARIGVGDAEGQSRVAHGNSEQAVLGEGRRQRLVAQDRKPGGERRARRGQMMMVRRNDGNEINAVAPLAFAREHGRDIGIGPGGFDSIRLACLARTARVVAKRAGDQLNLAIEFGGDAMNGSDEAPSVRRQSFPSAIAALHSLQA